MKFTTHVAYYRITLWWSWIPAAVISTKHKNSHKPHNLLLMFLLYCTFCNFQTLVSTLSALMPWFGRENLFFVNNTWFRRVYLSIWLSCTECILACDWSTSWNSAGQVKNDLMSPLVSNHGIVKQKKSYIRNKPSINHLIKKSLFLMNGYQIIQQVNVLLLYWH